MSVSAAHATSLARRHDFSPVGLQPTTEKDGSIKGA